MKTNRIRQNFLPLLTALIWGTAFVAQSIGAQYMGPFTFNAARAVIAFVFLLGLCALRSLWRRKTGNEVPLGARRDLALGGLACGPALLIADEPTTALDVTIQAQILELMKDLQKKTQMGIIFITHNLGVVAEICDKVSVMYAGKIVEQGAVNDIFYHPSHPYTQSLLSAVPPPHPEVEKRRQSAAYDKNASGVDYAQGTEHRVGGTHTVLGTDEEVARWMK